MIRRLLISLLLLTPSLAEAETVEIISGEHSDFSRLVMQFEGSPDWTFGRTENGYLLNVNSNVTYDVGRVFDRIPRRRISEVVDAGNGSITVVLNCVCHGDAFELRKGRVVVDIKDGPPDAASEFERPLRRAKTSPPNPVPYPKNFQAELIESAATSVPTLPSLSAKKSSEPAPPRPFRVDPWSPSLPRIGPTELAPLAGAFNGRVPGTLGSDAMRNSKSEVTATSPFKTATSAQADIDARMREALESVQSKRLAKAQSDLLIQLGRAATQGLVQAESQIREVGSALPAAPVQSVSEPEPGLMSLPTGRNVHIESAVDRDATVSGHTSGMNSEGDNCLADDEVDVASWGENNVNGVTTAQLATGLVGEFDRPDQPSLAAFAKRLIFMGFGAEVHMTLAVFDVDLPQARTLLALADVMDDEQSQDRSMLAMQVSCKSSVALWGVLAADQISDKHIVDHGVILREFSGLPSHLRTLLGPRLAQIFLKADDHETAVSIRNIVARTSAPESSSLDMMEAQIAKYSGKTQKAEELLSHVVSAGAPESTKAITDLIQMRTEQGQDVATKTAELAEALAFENRGTELGADLTIAAIRGLVAGGELSKALQTISVSAANGDLAADQVQPLRAIAIKAVANQSSDADFLLLTQKFPLDSTEIGESSQDARLAVASRLEKLGFSNWAETVLDSGADLTGPEEKKLLAKIALLEQRPEVAQSHLVGMQGEDVDVLRAKSFEMQGDYQAAAQLYSAHGLKEAQRVAAWQAEQWSDLEGVGRPAQAKAASAILAALADPLEAQNDNPAISQANAKALLNRAAELQTVVAELIGQ